MSSFSRSRRRRRRRRSRSRTSPAQREPHQLKRKKNLTSSRGKNSFFLRRKFPVLTAKKNPALVETGTVTLELGPVLNVHSRGRMLQLCNNTEEGQTRRMQGQKYRWPLSCTRVLEQMTLVVLGARIQELVSLAKSAILTTSLICILDLKLEACFFFFRFLNWFTYSQL
jgi:hypothetical protein